jgi:uncharacterized protein YdcH (DUF465 family)
MSRNVWRIWKMSNYANQIDKDDAHLEELKRRHRELDEYIQNEYGNRNITAEVYRLKTQKLWLKDEIHRIESSSKQQ